MACGANRGRETIQAAKEKGEELPRPGDTLARSPMDSTSVSYTCPLSLANAISVFLKPRGSGPHKLISTVSRDLGREATEGKEVTTKDWRADRVELPTSP